MNIYQIQEMLNNNKRAEAEKELKAQGMSEDHIRLVSLLAFDITRAKDERLCERVQCLYNSYSEIGQAAYDCFRDNREELVEKYTNADLMTQGTKDEETNHTTKEHYANWIKKCIFNDYREHALSDIKMRLGIETDGETVDGKEFGLNPFLSDLLNHAINNSARQCINVEAYCSIMAEELLREIDDKLYLHYSSEPYYFLKHLENQEFVECIMGEIGSENVNDVGSEDSQFLGVVLSAFERAIAYQAFSVLRPGEFAEDAKKRLGQGMYKAFYKFMPAVCAQLNINIDDFNEPAGGGYQFSMSQVVDEVEELIGQEWGAED